MGNTIQFQGENITKQRDRVCEIIWRKIGSGRKKKGGGDRKEVCKRETDKERDGKR